MPGTKFCGICGLAHDPDLPCNPVQQALRDAGIPRKRRVSRSFKSIVQEANRGLIIVLLIFMALVLFFLFVVPHLPLGTRF